MLATAEVDERTDTAAAVTAEPPAQAPPLPAAPPVDVVAETIPSGTAPVPRGSGLSTLRWFGISLALGAAAAGLGAMGILVPLAALLVVAGTIAFFISTLVAFSRAVMGIVAIVRAVAAQETAGLGAVAAAVLGNLVMTAFGMLVASLTTMGFSRGRQLRRFGKVLLPGVRPHGDWTGVTMQIGEGDIPPHGLADQWRENGRTEHASVGAFARVTLDLMALGAPPKLIAAANQDALDEIRHTELCFSLARALDGRSIGPGPFPQARSAGTLPRSRTLALAKLAVTSLIDGALHEGVSARIVARLARRSEVAAIRAALKEIAADEGRHAAHGWTAVEWCLDQGGRKVADALLGAIRTLPEEMHSQLPAAAADGGWERWGIHGRQLESEEYRAARAHVVDRVRARVSSSRLAA